LRGGYTLIGNTINISGRGRGESFLRKAKADDHLPTRGRGQWRTFLTMAWDRHAHQRPGRGTGSPNFGNSLDRLPRIPAPPHSFCDFNAVIGPSPHPRIFYKHRGGMRSTLHFIHESMDGNATNNHVLRRSIKVDNGRYSRIQSAAVVLGENITVPGVDCMLITRSDTFSYRNYCLKNLGGKKHNSRRFF